MIINLRGTSGAGKSTIVRGFMGTVQGAGHTISPIFVTGRKRPWYYRGESPRPWRVLGHYETACGGCDTIKTVDEVYRLVQDGLEAGEAVLLEGIMVQDDVRRAVAFQQQFGDYCVIALTTDIEECLRAVRSRREARGDTRPLSEKNTRGRAASLERTLRRLQEGGVHVERHDREAAMQRVTDLVSLPRPVLHWDQL